MINTTNFNETLRKPANIPSLELLRKGVKEDYKIYPDQGNLLLTGDSLTPNLSIPYALHYHPGTIIHQLKKIHLVAYKKITFEGRFMSAPQILLEGKTIELVDSELSKEPITTIAAQTKLILKAHEVYLNGISLRCYDSPIEFQSVKVVRYANIDLRELQKAAKFHYSCKFIEIEVIDD